MASSGRSIMPGIKFKAASMAGKGSVSKSKGMSETMSRKSWEPVCQALHDH